MSEFYCDQCGASNRAGARFCRQCRAEIAGQPIDEEAIPVGLPPVVKPIAAQSITEPLTARSALIPWQTWLKYAGLGAGSAVASLALFWVSYEILLKQVELAVPVEAQSSGQQRMAISLFFSALHNLAPQMSRLNLAAALLVPLRATVGGKITEGLGKAAGAISADVLIPTLAGLLIAGLPAAVAGYYLIRFTSFGKDGWRPLVTPLCIFALAYSLFTTVVITSSPIDTGQIPIPEYGSVSGTLSAPGLPLAVNAFLAALIFASMGACAAAAWGRAPEMKALFTAIPTPARLALSSFGANLIVSLIVVAIGLTSLAVALSQKQPQIPSSATYGSIPGGTVNLTPLTFLLLSGGVLSGRVTSLLAEAPNLWGVRFDSIQGIKVEGALANGFDPSTLQTAAALAVVLGIVLVPALIRMGFAASRQSADSRWQCGLIASLCYTACALPIAALCRISGSATVVGNLGNLNASTGVGQAYLGVDLIATAVAIWLPTAAWVALGVLLGGGELQPLRRANQ